MSPIRLLVVVALLLAPAVALGQPAAADAGARALADDVGGIRRALEQLVALQETAEHFREVDVLLRRIELLERRLEPVERQLQGAERTVRGMEDDLATLQKMREQNEDALDEEIKAGVDTPRSGTRNMLTDIERTLETREEQIKEARARARRFDDDLAERREEIEVLDDMLMELLEAEGR
jgi:chromosome segregation ATPase